MKYSTDPKTNRLRISRCGTSVCPDGTFRINKSNSLEYWLNPSVQWRRAHKLPSRICFNGSWRLTGRDDLQLTVARSSYMPEALSGISRITINGKIIAADAGALMFESASKDVYGQAHNRLLKLTGTWGTDDSNRITFSIAKRAAPDILTLTGKWAVNDNQQITYTIEKYSRARGERVVSTIEFSGYWKTGPSNRISYIFSKGSMSRFDLRAHIETPNVYPQEGKIKYRLGAGARRPHGKQPAVICLYGTWKINRDLGVSFEIDHEKGRVSTLEFGSRIDLSRKDRVEFSLLDGRGRGIGARLIYTRRFLKKLDAEIFVRLKRTLRQRGVDAGITIPF